MVPRPVTSFGKVATIPSLDSSIKSTYLFVNAQEGLSLHATSPCQLQTESPAILSQVQPFFRPPAHLNYSQRASSRLLYIDDVEPKVGLPKQILESLCCPLAAVN